MIDHRRRLLITGSLAGGALAAGLLGPHRALAEWNQAAFEATDPEAALRALLGQTTPVDDAAILIETPPLIDHNTEVAVTVSTALPEVRSITLITTGNPRPLAASFLLGPAALPRVSTRIRMAKTAELIAVVQQGERLLSHRRTVKVDPGNCAR